MAIVKVVVVILLIVIGAGLIVVGFLPSELNVVGETTIEAPAADVYPYLGDLNKWSRWTVLAESEHRPPEFTYLEPDDVPTLSWNLPGGTRVELALVDRQENRSVEYQLQARDGVVTMEGKIALKTEGGVTRVRWDEKGHVGFVGRLFRGRVERTLTADFARALERLKETVEGG